MTRLVREDIFEIEKKMKEYDLLFYKQTGSYMQSIAKKAAGFLDKVQDVSVATVSVTSGLGVISGFADTVAAILRYCGIDAAEMQMTDVGGIQEAIETKKDMIFLADDDIFMAFATGKRVQSDNGEATGLGYAVALLEAMRLRGVDPKEKKVLILGAGPVGCAAAEAVIGEGGCPCIYDTNTEKSKAFCEMHPQAVFLSKLESYRDYLYIVDASTAEALIDADDVSQETILAAPGMPCIATEAAIRKATVIHNPLELGVLTMYYQCLKKMEEKENGAG